VRARLRTGDELIDLAHDGVLVSDKWKVIVAGELDELRTRDS
jgi:hypothetical protein